MMFTDKPSLVENLNVNFASTTKMSGLFASTVHFVPPKRMTNFSYSMDVNCSWYSEVRVTVDYLLCIFQKCDHGLASTRTV